MSNPSIGMRYEDARAKAKKFARLDAPQVVRSLVNQVRLCEGETAAMEIIKEVGDTARSFSGAGNAQVGVGDGFKLGEGRWRRVENGKFERIR